MSAIRRKTLKHAKRWVSGQFRLGVGTGPVCCGVGAGPVRKMHCQQDMRSGSSQSDERNRGHEQGRFGIIVEGLTITIHHHDHCLTWAPGINSLRSFIGRLGGVGLCQALKKALENFEQKRRDLEHAASAASGKALLLDVDLFDLPRHQAELGLFCHVCAATLSKDRPDELGQVHFQR